MTDHETTEKEDSVSLSFSEEDIKDNKGDITISLKPLNEDEDLPVTNITATMSMPIKSRNKKHKFDTSANRSKFMKTAPSLMRLLSIGSMSSAKKTKTSFITLTNSNGETQDIVKKATNTNNLESAEPDLHHKSSVVNELLAEYEKNANYEHHSEQYDMELLAAKAAKEFEVLAIQNDELYKEKEQYKQKYDDLNHEYQQMTQTINEYEIYKQQNEQLTTENAKYQSQIKIYEQEKIILEEQIDSLHADNNNNNNNNNNDDISPDIIDNNNNNNNMDEQRLMVTRITKEKYELENQLEAFKINVNNDKAQINILNQKLINSQKEVERLSNNLTEQQNKYIKLQESKQEQTDKFDRQLSIHSDQIINEYKIKQEEFLQTIENQKKHIHELQVENQELQQYKVNNSLSVKDKKFNMNRLRTQQNVFGGNQQYDDDPFGGNNNYDDEQETFMNYNQSDEYEQHQQHEYEEEKESESKTKSDIIRKLSDSDDFDPQQHGAQDLNIEKEEKEEKEDIIMSVMHETENISTSNGCSCFLSFFNKFKQNNPKPLASMDNVHSDTSPLTINEMHPPKNHNDYILMK